MTNHHWNKAKVQWVVTRFRQGGKCGKQATRRGQGCFLRWTQRGAGFPFSCVHLQHSAQLKSILALCGFESRGGTRISNWGMNKWPTRIFPHGLTVWTDGPQVTGSPFQQSGAICSLANETAEEAKCQKGGEGREGSETGSEIRSAFNGD